MKPKEQPGIPKGSTVQPKCPETAMVLFVVSSSFPKDLKQQEVGGKQVFFHLKLRKKVGKASILQPKGSRGVFVKLFKCSLTIENHLKKGLKSSSLRAPLLPSKVGTGMFLGGQGCVTI